MKFFVLKNYRKGPATNSSSTHSILYKKKGEMVDDLNVMEENFYDRYTNTIAASREAKIKYVAANIMDFEPLFEEMCVHYPEMSKYKVLIQQQKDEMKKYWRNRNSYVFGMYDRGNLFFADSNYLEANIYFLKFLIENEEIIVVGGSDETDFIYEQEEGRENVDSPLDYHFYSKDTSLVKNGNYWVAYTHDGSRIRMGMDKGKCVPNYPELIDLKVTDMCHHNCPFCYAGSSSEGKHADIKFIKRVLWDLSQEDWYKKKVEFAIGGGNPLEYPQLKELLVAINKNGHNANITINASDCLKIDDDLWDVFCKTLRGIGVSIISEKDVEILKEFKKKRMCQTFETYPEIVCHFIPEMLGVERTKSLIDKLKQNGMYNFLFLGFKSCGRGKNIKYSLFSDSDLDKMFEDSYCISIDTTFANTYKDWIKKNSETEKYTVTYGEGEYSMFIDAVNETASKSSYETDKSYNMKRDEWGKLEKTWHTATTAFKQIRKDNGFEVS